MRFVINKTVDIDAPADVVWEVLTDLPRYGEWNPFVLECQSSLKPGEAIDMKVRLGNRLQTANEVMLEFEPKRRFAYRMKPLPPGALASYRSHDLNPLDGKRCRYVSHFELCGWLMPLVRALMGRQLEAGFAGMTDGLKQRAEQVWAQRQAGRG
ncbi:MAG TPA: SRPBCC domain-containing protein [Nevskiales bacterium]|nr:SRPBCC domain-containing protein [Nevskiales bacterium]